MQNKKYIGKMIAGVLLCLCLFSFGFVIHSTQNKVVALTQDVRVLRQDLRRLESELTGKALYLEDGINYLAVGNSITIHGVCDYWWTETGMAASEKEKDYYHRIAAWMKTQYSEVMSYALNLSAWEIAAHDRTQTLQALVPYLDSELDVVTIQLSENVTDMTTLKEDYIELIQLIKGKCPNAAIIMIDDVWSEEKSVCKKQIAAEMGVPFVELSAVRADSSFLCGMGTVVYGENGQPHTVEHAGVAKHPGDKAMTYMADAVIEILRQHLPQ